MTTTDSIVDGEIEHVDEIVDTDSATPAATEALVRRDPVRLFELDQRRAEIYAASGYWPDTRSMAQALVRIEAGRELGLPAIVAMSEVHVIQGKPTLGAGALAALLKAGGRYDYRVVELTEQRCVIRFFDLQAGELGESVFTIDDARKAGLAGRSTWKQYPRNMLFARSIANGTAWFCPDATLGRVYTPEELDVEIVDADVVESEATVVEETSTIVDAAADRAGAIPPELRPPHEQMTRIGELLLELTERHPDIDWKAEARRIAGCPGDKLTATIAAMLIDELEARLEEGV